MEMTPESTPAKRAGAKTTKPKVTVKTAEPKAAAAKKPRAPRKTLTTKSAAPESPVEMETSLPSDEPTEGRIAVAAYYLAAARNFMPGHELDDWLEAERNIRSR